MPLLILIREQLPMHNKMMQLGAYALQVHHLPLRPDVVAIDRQRHGQVVDLLGDGRVAEVEWLRHIAVRVHAIWQLLLQKTRRVLGREAAGLVHRPAKGLDRFQRLPRLVLVSELVFSGQLVEGLQQRMNHARVIVNLAVGPALLELQGKQIDLIQRGSVNYTKTSLWIVYTV